MKISDFKLVSFEQSAFIKPQSATFRQNGVAVRWDFIKCFDCVSTFIYHAECDAFVFVRQFRAPLCAYFSGDITKGYSIELCSGIVDKKLPLEQIAAEECAEELGLKVQLLEPWGEFYGGFGSGVSVVNLFFARVNSADFAEFDYAAASSALAQNGFYSDDYQGGCDLGECTQRLWVARGFYEQFFSEHHRSALIDYSYLKFSQELCK